MNDQTVSEIVEELRPHLSGRAWGKVFLLSRTALAVDLRTNDGRYLFISTEPAAPRLYMIDRRVRELEKQSLQPTPFVLMLRKALAGATLVRLSKDEGDRVVRFHFAARDAAGRDHSPALVAQLTGRSSNLFLLDDAGRVVETLRPARGAGQEPGELYRPPAPAPPREDDASHGPKPSAHVEPFIDRRGFASLSEALDAHFMEVERERVFDARAAALAQQTRAAADKRRKLLRNLEQDLARHGDAETHKRVGDLLLANIATAVREGTRVRVTDYYAEGTPTVELEVEEGRSLQEEAGRRFSRYTKAKRAAEEVAARIGQIKDELDALEVRRAELDDIIAARDAEALEEFAARTGGKRSGGEPARKGPRQKTPDHMPGARRYRSSDGYEILVGRSASDNDRLTFRVARSQDLWLHAADYPGSHVVVRNAHRGEAIPHRTVIEAAQLAAQFSQARRDAKVAVHYAERKFVSKVKGGAPGLVRLSSFRTLLVEPSDELERI